MRVIVARTGGTWHGVGSTSAGSRSTLTSQANHDAVTRAIRDGGHDVLCVGKIAGALDLGERTEQLSWSIRPELGVDSNMGEIRECVQACVEWKPDVLVNVCGAEVTNTTPTNARGNDLQAMQWRYYWPFHEIMRELRLPRICVVTDCRCYPREQEFHDDPWAIPAAVLSQETKTIDRRVLDKTLRCRAVYAGVERLRLKGVERRAPLEGGYGIVAMAHAHMTDGRIKRGRQKAWEALTRREAFVDPITAYGEGWDAFDDTTSAIDPQPSVPHHDVQRVLNFYHCGPLMPMRHGWISPKLGEYARAGCVPLPHGRGGPLTYDWCEETQDGHVVAREHWCRVASAEELRDRYDTLRGDYALRQRLCDEFVLKTEPDSSLLLECVEWFGRGNAINERYGGMRWQDSST